MGTERILLSGRDGQGNLFTGAYDLTTTTAPDLPLVQPIAGEKLRRRWWMCDHASWGGLYSNRAAVMDLIGGGRWGGIRGLMGHGGSLANGRTIETAERANALNLGWCAAIQTTDASSKTEAELRATIKWCAETPVVAECLRRGGAFEGPNEWNGKVGWNAARVVNEHKIMRDELSKYQTGDSRSPLTTLDGVKIAGASCHDNKMRDSNGQEAIDIMAIEGGIYNEITDYQATHSYPAGDDVDTEAPRRTGYWTNAGYTKGFVFSETGWQQAGGFGGGVKITEQQAAILASRAPFIAQKMFETLGVHWLARYEILEDEQAADRFGVVDCMNPPVTDPALGRKKPEYAKTAEILGDLMDLGQENYVPPKVRVKVEGAGVSSRVWGRSDGVVKVALWQTDDKATTPVPCVVKDVAGDRPFTIGPMARSITVRV